MASTGTRSSLRASALSNNGRSVSPRPRCGNSSGGKSNVTSSDGSSLAPPAWLLGRSPSPSRLHGIAGKDFGRDVGVTQPRQAYDVQVKVECEARPSFTRGPRGTYIMELSDVAVQMATTCDPNPLYAGFRGSSVFKPHEDFLVSLPEVHRVVFDTTSQTPAGLSMTATARKHVTVLEVPSEHDLSAKLRTNSPSGSVVLDDVRYTGHHREVVSEVVLHYELRANGQISIVPHGSKHQLSIDFVFDFECWLSGFVSTPIDGSRDDGVQTCNTQTLPQYHKQDAANCPDQAKPPNAAGKVDSQTKRQAYASRSLRLSFLSEQAMTALDTTNEALSQIEKQVDDASAMLSYTPGSDLSQLKCELSQLEAKAKQLEAKGIDDVYTSELHSGRQMAKDAKKDMLVRFERLFGKLDETFSSIKVRMA